MAKYIITIIVLCLVIYANSLWGEFVSDDLPQIVNNPDIGTIKGCRSVLTCANSAIYAFGGLNPAPFHVFSLVIYALSCVLVFYFLLSFFGLWPAFLGALLFTAHPIHVEAVSWISGTPYALSSIFIISSFLLYRRATRDKFILSLYLFSIVLQALNFITCWYAVIFPLMLVFYDFVYGRVRKRWRLWLPYFSLIVLWALIWNVKTMLSARISSLQVKSDVVSSSNLFFNLIFSFFKHGQLIVFPARLTLYHEPMATTLKLLTIGGVALVAILLLLPLLYKKAKPLLFALGIYTLFLLPTYSPRMISWLIAERYVYLSSLGFCMAVIYLLDKAAASKRARNFALCCLIAVIGIFSARTILRNNDWRTRASLWRATAAVSPLSYKAHNNMGDIYGLEGDVERAAQSFKRATELNPVYGDAYHNLANTYMELGRTEDAIANYKKAISVKPGLYQSYQSLGAIYFNRGERVTGLKYLKKSLEINPDNPALAEAVRKIEKENR